MHLLVTDRLACPRCGPEFGLILLSDVVRDRRILEGHFGCANCRERYPVRGGFGDFRPPPAAPLEEEPEGADPGPDDAEGGLRLAAMLGVSKGPAHLLLVGAPARQGERLAAMIEGAEVVALHPGLRGRGEVEGVSRLHAGSRLPFFSMTFRGTALGAAWARTHLDEAFRVTAPGARVVVELPDPDAPGGEAARGEVVTAVTGQVREVLLETDRHLVGVR